MAHFLRLHEIGESSHRILNPITVDKLMLVGDIISPTPETRILDLCCGKGELLAQFCATYGCSGHGVDIGSAFLAAAHDRAGELGVADRVTFTQQDAAEFGTDERFDVVCCIGASWFGGGLEPSLKAMRQFASDDPILLLGEPFWQSHTPDDVMTDQYGVFRNLAGTFERIESGGLEVVEMVLADGDSWDRYAAAQWKNQYDWIRANPDDPDVDEVRERLRDSRREYVTWMRDYFGWGIFVLRPALGS